MSPDLAKVVARLEDQVARVRADSAALHAALASVVLPPLAPVLTKADGVRTGPVGPTAKEYIAKADECRSWDPDRAAGYRQLAAEAEQREMARPRPRPAAPSTWTPPPHLASTIDAMYRRTNY